jgi:uncharacterized protein
LSAYVDTSIIVSALTPEINSKASQAWLEAQSPGSLYISPWVATEIHSALAMKVRTEQITVEEKSRTLAYFRAAILPELNIIDVAAADFAQAANFLDYESVALRSGDALHLAIASRNGIVIATHDKRLQDAARTLQIAFVSP